jgi:hypothetical protein
VNEANTLADVIGHDPETIDQAHERLGHTAPRVTPADLEASIASAHYFTAAEGVIGASGCERGSMHGPLNLVTICVLVMRNGFVEIGTSAPASPENFNAELGQRLARENAVRKLWPLMGYALREQLHRSQGVGEAARVDER